MVEESYVSFETAKMLKEAGFDVECDWFYINDGNVDTGIVVRSTSPRDHNMGTGFLSRPTQDLAARWLREVYNVAIYSLYDDDMEQWFYVVDAFTKNPVIDAFQSGSEYDDYESAFESGLQYSLELIKK